MEETTNGQVESLSMWMPGEHQSIGDSVTLHWPNGQSPNILNLKNGLQLTYSEINLLAGDFFGTSNPISSDPHLDQQKKLFMDAFKTLAEDASGVVRAKEFLKLVKKEEEFVSKNPPAKSAYEKWDDRDLFEIQEKSLLDGPVGSLDYNSLLKINIDHFQPYAREAYNAGHALAIEMAKAGHLEGAYAINAFADHFLQDSFASGHYRVPRKELMDSYPMQICANLMHNEDNSTGLQVVAPLSAITHNPDITFQAFGDDSLDVGGNATNKKQCIAAAQASVDEVFHAFDPSFKQPPSPWQFAATVESMASENNPCPMFSVQMVNGKSEVWMRKDLQDLKATPPPPGKWEFESVVQSKVLYFKALEAFFAILPLDWQVTLCWWSLAYGRAPSGYYSSKLIEWLEEEIKTSSLPTKLRDWLVSILEGLNPH